jgi:hypothetical protein
MRPGDRAVSNVRLRIICPRHGRVMAKIVEFRGRRFVETKGRGRESYLFDEADTILAYCPRSTNPFTQVPAYIIEAALRSPGLAEIHVDCHRGAVLPL